MCLGRSPQIERKAECKLADREIGANLTHTYRPQLWRRFSTIHAGQKPHSDQSSALQFLGLVLRASIGIGSKTILGSCCAATLISCIRSLRFHPPHWSIVLSTPQPIYKQTCGNWNAGCRRGSLCGGHYS